jgi:hypothetical protein
MLAQAVGVVVVDLQAAADGLLAVVGAALLHPPAAQSADDLLVVDLEF